MDKTTIYHPNEWVLMGTKPSIIKNCRVNEFHIILESMIRSTKKQNHQRSLYIENHSFTPSCARN